MLLPLFAKRPLTVGKRQCYGDGLSQFADLRLPEKASAHRPPYPVVIALHGGFWRSQYEAGPGTPGRHIGFAVQEHTCVDLTAHGVATVNVEYRRTGEVGGGWPGALADVIAACDMIASGAAKHSLDLERVVMLGFSAGAQLALAVAAPTSARRLPFRLAGVVSLAGVIDLRRCSELDLRGGAVHQYLGGTPAEVPERYDAASPIQLVPLGVRQLIVHGTQDKNVPHDFSVTYTEAARASGDLVNFLSLAGATHFDLVDPSSQVWPRIRDQVVLLTSPPTRSESP